MNRTFIRLIALSLFVFLSTSLRVNAQSPTDLYISEYIEGSSNNKAIELFNGTGG